MNNLKTLREMLGFEQQKEFAKTLGIPPNTYGGYENGQREPKIEFWVMLADKYKVAIDWLMGFSDDPHKTKYEAKSVIEERYSALDAHGKRLVDAVMDIELGRVEQPAPKIIDLGTIRKYLSRPAAGVNGMVEGEDYEDIPRTPDMPKDADFCLIVSGDSMEPYIKDGEMIYVTEKEALKELDVGVFVVDGATYVKQFVPSYDGNLYLLSANPKRQDANITIYKTGNQNFQYFGKVILKKKLPRPVYEWPKQNERL